LLCYPIALFLIVILRCRNNVYSLREMVNMVAILVTGCFQKVFCIELFATFRKHPREIQTDARNDDSRRVEDSQMQFGIYRTNDRKNINVPHESDEVLACN
jgi:hypothetical protein